MSSNNDNRENIEDEKEDVSAETEKVLESDENEKADETEENLIDISDEDVDDSEEKMSLKDVLESVFDTDDETESSNAAEIETISDDGFSTVSENDVENDTPTDAVIYEDEQVEEPEKIAAVLNEIFEDDDVKPESEEVVESEDKAVESESEEVVESEDEEVESESEEVVESEDEAVEPESEEVVESENEAIEPESEEVVESEDEAIEPESEEVVESENEAIEPESEEVVESENEAIEPESEEVVESENEAIEPESEEVVESEDEAIEPESEEVVESEDEAIEPESEEVVESQEFSDSEIWEEDESETLPEAFFLGKDVIKNNPAEYAESDENETEIQESYSTDESDEENISAITVHRHSADTDENENESVDLYEAAKSADEAENESDNKSFFERHSLVKWAKSKTAGGWVKFGLKCFGVLLLLLCISAVLYFNGLLNLIDYKDADDFEQYYNLSDTDYEIGDEEVYSTPVYYNSSTTIEGFDESMIDIPKEDVINILLIGTDVRNGSYDDRGNTDSMILLSINTRDKNIKLTSFMRDMYVTIPGRGKNRINAAYAYGGPQLLFDTLKTNFDVDVDLYARVNFNYFKKIIDQVGGIQIELTEAEARYMNKYSYKYGTDTVQAGLQTLDGAQALSYARCRKIDSDFNRTQRQRKVIVAFIEEIKSCSITELNSLLNTLLPMIQTNVSKMQILSLMVDSFNYLNTEVETLNIPIKNSWQSATINQMSVLCPNFELNKTAIVAHIYSTYKLDVEDTVFRSFEIPESDSTKKTSYRSTTQSSAATTSSTEMTVDESTTLPTDDTTGTVPDVTDTTITTTNTTTTTKSTTNEKQSSETEKSYGGYLPWYDNN